jgi:hypothetical protein
MSTPARSQPRQPRGMPTGGQWRASARPEGTVALDQNAYEPSEWEEPPTTRQGSHGQVAGARRHPPVPQGARPLADESIRAQVTLAAVAAINAEGPSEVPYEQRVVTAAMRIAALMAEESVVARALASLSRCDRPFIGVPTRSELEEASNRRVVYFETLDRETGEVKTETLRTERMDDPLGQLVFAQAKANRGRPVRI